MSEDRPVLGMETEYAIVFASQVGARGPLQRRVFDVLADALKQLFLCTPALYAKEGLFLENGSLLHYECNPESTTRGLLEISTPECSSVREVVAYHRAQERILSAVLPATQARLQGDGFTGDVVVARTNGDYLSNTYGSHENYLVEDPRTLVDWIAALAGFTIVGLFRLPFLLLRLVAANLGMLALLAAFVPLAVWAVIAGLTGSDESPERVIDRCVQWSLGWLVPVCGRVATAEGWVVGAVLAAPIRWGMFPRYRKHLVPFLVTRTVFAGPGCLMTSDPDGGAAFVLSSKASAIRRVMGAFLCQADKPMIDLKHFLGRERWSALFGRKRLHIAFSDSNMSEFNLWLKLASTELVIRAIERGFLPESCELADPIGALRIVSGDLTLSRALQVRKGPARTAIWIQREYLAAATRYVDAHRPRDREAREVLVAWARVLDGLEADPAGLSSRLDWVAKLGLMREAAGDDWESAMRSLGAVRFLEEQNVGLGRALDRPGQVEKFLMSRLGAGYGQFAERLKHAGIPIQSFARAYLTFYQIKKIDLKYHQIGRDRGYYLQMEAAGAFARVLSETAVGAAIDQPPAGTRAEARIRCIREASARNLEVHAGWHDVFVPASLAFVALPEPGCAGPCAGIGRAADSSLVRIGLHWVMFLPKIVTYFF